MAGGARAPSNRDGGIAASRVRHAWKLAKDPLQLPDRACRIGLVDPLLELRGGEPARGGVHAQEVDGAFALRIRDANRMIGASAGRPLVE